MSRVAKRYAKAIFELSIETEVFETVESEFTQIVESINNSAELENFLINPLISNLKKGEVVRELFKDKVSDLTYRFMLLVAKKGRLSVLPEIIDQFRCFSMEYRNQVEGELLSAVSLSGEQIGKIRKIIENMTGKIVVLKEKVNVDILGGFIVKIEDKLIDVSVRSNLEKMKKRLITG